MKKKIIAFLAVLLIFCNFNIAAEEGIKIAISNVSAQRETTAWVDVKIENNTGLSAITVSITYDSTALEYSDYKAGLLTDCSLKAYPTENTIRFVSLEDSDIKKDGILLSLGFKVSADAEFKKYPITIEYSSGDFSNQNADALSPEIVSGGIEVIQMHTSNTESSSHTDSSHYDGESSAVSSSSSSASPTDSKEYNSSAQQSSATVGDSSSAVTDAIDNESSLPLENSSEASKTVSIPADGNSSEDSSIKKTESENKERNLPINPILLISAIIVPLAFLFIIILKRKK